MGAFPLAGRVLVGLGQRGINVHRGKDLVESQLVLHRRYELGDDVAGVDWILAENWWPYQRPTFVTPPFAGL